MKALVRFDSTDSWVCTIKDFCAGGMLLQGDRRKMLKAHNGEDGDGPSRGTGLEVHFAVRDREGLCGQETGGFSLRG